MPGEDTTSGGREQEDGLPGGGDDAHGQDENRPDGDARDAGGERFTLKVCGKTVTVGREEAIALAQKGADYDRVKAGAEELRRWRDEVQPKLQALAHPAEREDFKSFLTQFPQVAPADIPKEVWKAVEGGESLTLAWLKNENRRLSAIAEAAAARSKGAAETTGSRASDGRSDARDWMLAGWDE